MVLVLVREKNDLELCTCKVDVGFAAFNSHNSRNGHNRK